MTLRLDLLAADVKHLRAERTLRDLASELGVSPATLCRVESGDAPDLENFAKLVTWLGIDPASYLGLPSGVKRTPRCGRCDRIRRILAATRGAQ